MAVRKAIQNTQGREFMFLTNATELTAHQVADLYKNRWQIELFFYEKYIVMRSRHTHADAKLLIA